MGSKASAFFMEAEKLGGMAGKTKLAGYAKMTSAQASGAEDTPELLARFDAALAMLRNEGKGAKAPTSDVKATIADPRALRRHIQVYLDLMTQRSLVLGDVTETARRVNEAAAEALEVARVSIWAVDDAGAAIRSVDLYEQATRKHSAGVVLSAKDFPPYFTALHTERTIAASDAHTDARTSCFTEVYLKPLGIGALLDVPIFANGKMYGVVCHEHVGGPRAWTGDEEKFAYLMAAFVSLALERRA